MTVLLEPMRQIAELGGPVVMLLIAVSIVTLATVIYKLWQFAVAGVGRHTALKEAVSAWDMGDGAAASAALSRSSSYLAPVIEMAFSAQTPDMPRLAAEAESRFARLESGFRMLDSVAQLAPLLGLFGTVLGMIEAFQSMQDAGAQVDPSLLAGGIWVALLTTAVGLVVAMPTALILSWFEGRMDRERVTAERALTTVIAPRGSAAAQRTSGMAGEAPARRA
ncbi:MotA/TolQ/ExbB proton channel family protein [Roseovarius pelagicus]|uniref:MotA/TolQ/ExbB proton channel family protein n=1 Tax=Roseovarius pelagicus TaxID=2980108 RepID=A0ABY6D8D3_9RHOB|nr:MotA/TolQ/ExbB proton channel family protein [Roseovarius pelagicus]UXX82382.1 MotA/TolQ/ExbB proton channel family protein [Roseovarius pelagicus]